MSMNNPANSVTFTPEKSFCFYNGVGDPIHGKAGVEITVPKHVYSHCVGRLHVLNDKDKATTLWLIDIAPGASYEAEPPTGATALTFDAQSALLLYTGTDIKPLVLPEDFTEIKDGSADMIKATEMPKSILLKEDGEPINKVALVNCGVDPVKAEFVWSICK